MKLILNGYLKLTIIIIHYIINDNSQNSLRYHLTDYIIILSINSL